MIDIRLRWTEEDAVALQELLPRQLGESGVEWAVRAYKIGLIDQYEEGALERMVLAGALRRPRTSNPMVVALLASALVDGDSEAGGAR